MDMQTVLDSIPPDQLAGLFPFLTEEEQRQFDDLLSVINLTKAPQFRGAALDIQDYRGHEFLISGPAETGKTYSCLWLLDKLMRETPKAKVTLLRKVQASINGTVLVTWKAIQQRREEMGDKPALPYGGEHPEWYSYPNGARLWIGGLDNPNKILSGERDFIYVNQAEELSANDWEILTTRCTGRGCVTQTPMIFGDCNPGAGDHWILKREALKLFHSKHEDNPSLFDENGNLTPQGIRTMTTLDALTGVRKSRLRYGLWVGAEGLFFEEWDEDLHTCDQFPIPADWPVWGALDYGFRHPTAFLLFTMNDGIIYVVGEHSQHGWLPPSHCIAIRRLMERKEVLARVRQIVAGHDCFQMRGDSQGKTIAQQYASARHPETGVSIGINLEKANVDRVSGAAELLTRLGNHQLAIGPTLKIFRDCQRTIAGMTRMVADPNDPETIKKMDADANGEGGDDEIDVLRYGVMTRHQKPIGVEKY